MEIEQSSLYREVMAVIKSPSKPVHHTWTAEIHANGKTYKALKVLSVDNSADYEANYGDEMIVELAISGGTYASGIYPFQTNLDITMYRTPIGEVSSMTDEEKAVQSERYTATLLDTGNPLLEGNGANTPDEKVLNLTNIFKVSFQLVNKALEQIRMISVGGIYRKALVGDVIKGILTKESMGIKVEGVRLPKGVNMVEASNKTPRDHIVIPQGTLLTKIPAYIQEHCGGVYSAGLGYYLQSDYWYVYPCYDTTRFNQATETLTVINVPPNKFPGVERTFRKDGKNLVILATGEVKFRDDSDAQQLNQGNGVRFSDANKFMEGFTITAGNKTLARRGGTNSELMSVKRANGNNNVRMSDRAINANAFQEYSKLARRSGSVVSFVWENSQPELIFPGMMVKMLYLKNGEIAEVYGVMLKAHHYAQLRGEGMTSTRYGSSSVLSVFIKRPT